MQDKENMWYLDNKASNHMCRDKHKYMELDKAVNCVIYLSNRCPTKSLNSMTPVQEAWSRRKPSVSQLKVFGSIVYVHINDQVRTKLDIKKKKRTKLDNKSKKMIFVGYDQKSKWYKLYGPNEGKMVISINIEFNEEKAWDWKVNDGEKYDFLSTLDEKEKIIKNI
jgi:hypothetical protein